MPARLNDHLLIRRHAVKTRLSQQSFNPFLKWLIEPDDARLVVPRYVPEDDSGNIDECFTAFSLLESFQRAS